MGGNCSVGELWCGRVAACGSRSVGELQCWDDALWGCYSVGKLRCGGDRVGGHDLGDKKILFDNQKVFGQLEYFWTTKRFLDSHKILDIQNHMDPKKFWTFSLE